MATKEKDRTIIASIICNITDIKFLIATIFLFAFILATLLIPNSDYKSSLSFLSSIPHQLTPQLETVVAEYADNDNNSSSLVTKRTFSGFGSAAYLFVQMGAYRGGPTTFSVVGLSSKPLHVYSNLEFTCRWVPPDQFSPPIAGASFKILPDWGYGRVYTVVVINCTFPVPVTDGGKLIISSLGQEFTALTETPDSVNLSVYTSPPKYDYLYCGSSLYGDLSPQRVREWIAYHVRLFGERSHFVIHDAGGVHEEVREVLRPWIEMGFVTLQDIRDQERFDGYYHNQFLVVNDCLHRYRFDAKWIFFFDVDEFIYVHPRLGLGKFMQSMEGFTQFTIEQRTMSSKVCLQEDEGKHKRMWGMEKLVYQDVKRGIRRDRKYAIQPRNTYAVGVHLSQNFDGKTTHKTEGRIKYFHYHGTIANRNEPCQEFTNSTEITIQGTPYVRDDTLRGLVRSVKMFERKMIGNQSVHTRQ